MTPRQKWLALLHGVPFPGPVCDYWATPEVTRRLLAELHCPDEKALWMKLGVDKCIFLAPRHPRAREDTWHIPSLFSVWGVPTRKVPYLDGLGTYEEAVDPPLARAAFVRDIETYPRPEPSEWDASELRGQCLQWTGYPIVGASYEPFYPCCRLRGMDRRELAAEFGHRVIFHGAVDNQITLPFGTPEDVKREVRENRAIFSRGRGYIVAPCHNLQANTPTENILALYEAVAELRPQ
jgi:hypothetical protein